MYSILLYEETLKLKVYYLKKIFIYKNFMKKNNKLNK